jgi:hypothetical protein
MYNLLSNAFNADLESKLSAQIVYCFSRACFKRPLRRRLGTASKQAQKFTRPQKRSCVR